MMEAMFSFGGRLGRLPYFLRTLAVVAAVCVGAVAIVLGAAAWAKALGGIGSVVAVLCVVPLFGAVLWSSLSLQARRIRDIGWDPGVVIGGWFLFNVADGLVLPHLLPAWAHGRGTYLGSAVNLGLSLILLLWPGRSGEAGGDIDLAALPPTATRSGAPQFGRRGLR